MTRLRIRQGVRVPAGTGTFLFATAPGADLKLISLLANENREHFYSW